MPLRCGSDAELALLFDVNGILRLHYLVELLDKAHEASFKAFI